MPDLTLVNAQSPPRDATGETNTPLGCLYIAATLQPHGYDVDFRDYQFSDADRPHDPDALAAWMEDPAGVLAVGCMVDFLPTTVLALEIFKRRHPQVPVVVGGPGPSDVPEGLLERFPWIDVVVEGEGEDTMVELMARLTTGEGDLSEVAGILYRRDGAVHRTAARPRIQDLDRIPFPQPAGVDLTRYDQVHLMTSRGCPYKCTFCDVSQLWHREVTYRSVENVVEEMRSLRRLGLRLVALQDDNLTVHRKRLRQLVARLEEADDVPEWTCLGRVDLVNEELLAEMERAGCRGIFYGVESGSDAVLGRIMKGTKAHLAARTVETTLEHFPAKTYFIWGYPEETAEDLARTLLLMSYLRSLGAVTPLTLLAPLPSSELYREHRDELRLEPRLFAHNFVSGLRFEDNDRRVLDLIRAHPDLFPSFYTFATPEVEEKLSMVERFRSLNELEMAHPRRLSA